MRKRFLLLSVGFYILSFTILYLAPGSIQHLREGQYNSDLLFPFSVYEGMFSPGSHVDWVFGG